MALVLCLALAPARAQQKPPILDLAVDNDAAKVSLRPSLQGGGFELTPIFKAGMLAPFGVDASYPTLLPSPFGLVGIKTGFTGPLEALVVVTHGVMDMTSQRLGGPLSASVASPTARAPEQNRFEQRVAVTSIHADAGKVFGIGDAWKAAVYAATDGWFARPQSGGDNGGAALMGGHTYSTGLVAVRRSGIHELTLNAQVQGETAAKTMWRNGENAVIPSGSAGAEYALVDGSYRTSVGADVITSPADAAVRPFLKWQDPKLALTVAADLRQSKDAFYPDRRAFGAEARYALTPGINLEVSGQGGVERYTMAPEPTKFFRALVGLSIDLGNRVEARVSRAVASDGARRAFDAGRSVAMNDSLRSPQDRLDFRAAMLASPTFEDFVARYPARGTDRILASVSQLTDSISRYNYNYTESKETPNVNDAREFYERVRNSALTNSKDPITVCIGSAQFGALLAQELGRREGLRIEATAVTVRVPSGQTTSGHAVSAIKTDEYGIVFVDWGKMTPTYTWDTKEAMRIYQALQGVPAMYHAMTAGPDGRPVGYLYTEEGKMVLRQLTAYGEIPEGTLERLFRDTPSAGPRAVERYGGLVRSR